MTQQTKTPGAVRSDLKPYLVTWEIDVEATSSAGAAQTAWETLREHDSTATVFVVHSASSEPVCIDLAELTEDQTND